MTTTEPTTTSPADRMVREFVRHGQKAREELNNLLFEFEWTVDKRGDAEGPLKHLRALYDAIGALDRAVTKYSVYGLDEDWKVGDIVTYGDMANPTKAYVVIAVSDDPWSTYKIRELAAPYTVTTTDGRQAGWTLYHRAEEAGDD
jgi:hypothetical protein